MAEALQKGCRHVITTGFLQSNHCRTTAIAAAQLGLKTHLILRTDLVRGLSYSSNYREMRWDNHEDRGLLLCSIDNISI